MLPKFNKTNVIAGAILCVVFGAPIGYIIRDRNPPTPESVIEPVVEKETGDSLSVAVGELVRLEGDGQATVWTIEPAVSDFVSYGNDNEKCAVSFRVPGRYIIYQSRLRDKTFAGETVEVVRVVINVGESATPVLVSDWDSKFSAWGIVDKAEAGKLSKAFASVANDVDSQVAAGTLVGPDRILLLTKNANQSALGNRTEQWRPFFDKLNAELGVMAESGQLQTMADHVRVWREISAAFDRAAK